MGWFLGLPVTVQIAACSLLAIIIVILAVIGKVNIRIGKYNLSFGKPAQPIKKRSCSDCRKLVMTRTMKFDQDLKIIRDEVLRDQMNYAEQKIIEISYFLTSSYREDIIKARNGNVDIVRENKEYLLYQEAIGNAMSQIKNTIRSAFKENGFYELSNQEFSDYVKGKTKLLISMGREYVRSRYPFENMIVPIEERFARLPEAIIESAVMDLFTKAKQIKQAADEKLEALCDQYDKDLAELERV